MHRAQRLLLGGAAGGHLAAFSCVVAFWLVSGASAGVSAAVAAAATLAFYIVGLAVQVAVADAPPRRILIASLLSYLARVGLLAALIAWVATQPHVLALLDPIAIVVTTIGVVLGWLAAEVWTFSRLRIPVFDPPTDTAGKPADDGHAGD